MSNTASLITTTATAVASSGALWGGVQWFITRKQRVVEERRRREEEQFRRERSEDERRELLAEAQRTAQRTALESAKERYDLLRTDYTDCRQGLVEIRDATSLLIDLFETLIIRLQPADEEAHTYTAMMSVNELGAARRAINEARRHLR